MIPVFKPHIGAETIKAATDALELGWLGMGSYVRDFEQALRGYLELPPDRHVVAVNTCTSALHLALLVAGVGPGDEVLTPALNNIGDMQAIAMCGATPVFVDIEDSRLGIDPERLARAISPKCKAVIILHYMGIPCDRAGVYAVARQHGLRVIEDAAHAIGTRESGKPIGSEGDLACYSFDAIKTLTCIDGGAVVTPGLGEAERLFPLRLLGMTQSNERLYGNARAYQFDVPGPGFRYHLANLHASIGLSQLAKLAEFIANRRRYCRLYNELLGDLKELIVPQTDYVDVSVFNYVVRVLGGRREALAQHLRERGIDSGIHWIPANQFSWLRNARGADQLPVTDRVGQEILTLPLWSYMEESIIEQVAGAVREFYAAGVPAKATRQITPEQRLQSTKRRVTVVPIEGHDGVVLRSVSTAAPAAADVRCLTRWRNRHVSSFLTEFEATEARTRRWLTESVDRDDSRVLFMIESGGVPIGYVGLAFIDWKNARAEADSVVRGEGGHPGVMSAAMRSLITWARSELGIERIGVRVLSDNPALGFYVKFGFREVQRVPLVPSHEGDSVAWEPAPGATGAKRELVHMELS